MYLAVFIFICIDGYYQESFHSYSCCYHCIHRCRLLEDPLGLQPDGTEPPFPSVSLSHLYTYATWNTGSNSVGGNSIYNVYVDSGGILYAGTNGGGLSVYDGTSWATHTIADGIGSNDVRSVYVDNAGVLYAGTSGGLSVYEIAYSF